MLSSKKTLLYVVISLFMVSIVSAGAWIPIGLIDVHPDTGVNIAGFFIKINSVDRVEQVVTFTLKQRGQEIAQGYVTPQEEFRLKDKVIIQAVSFAEIHRYGDNARLRISSWVDGQITNANSPNYFSFDNKYNIWTQIKNTGFKDTLFEIVFTQDGEYVKQKDMWRTEGGLLVPRFLNLAPYIRYVRIPPGEEARINFDTIIAHTGQTSKLGMPIFKKADLVFYLLAEGQLLDIYTFPDVTLTSVQSGYIEDVILPPVMVRDQAYKGEAIIYNGGFAHGGIESDKFFFEEKTGSIALDPYRFDLPAYSSLRYIFDFRPKSVGKQKLNFDFSLKGKTLDTYELEVDIVDGVSSYIDSVNHPPEVKFGEEFDVSVIIKNLGPSREVELQFSAPGMLDTPLKHILTLAPQATIIKTFQLTATGQGNNPIVVALVSHESAQDIMKNYDPYAEGDIIHKKESSVMIVTPSIEGISIEPTIPEVIVKEPVSEIVVEQPPVIIPPADVVQPDEQPSKPISPGLAGLIIVLIILALLVARLIWGPGKEFS